MKTYTYLFTDTKLMLFTEKGKMLFDVFKWNIVALDFRSKENLNKKIIIELDTKLNTLVTFKIEENFYFYKTHGQIEWEPYSDYVNTKLINETLGENEKNESNSFIGDTYKLSNEKFTIPKDLKLTDEFKNYLYPKEESNSDLVMALELAFKNVENIPVPAGVKYIRDRLNRPSDYLIPFTDSRQKFNEEKLKVQEFINDKKKIMDAYEKFSSGYAIPSYEKVISIDKDYKGPYEELISNKAKENSITEDQAKLMIRKELNLNNAKCTKCNEEVKERELFTGKYMGCLC